MAPGLRLRDAGEQDGLATLVAVDGEHEVGWLTWETASGTVDGIEVVGGYRRRGIATALWGAALARCPYLRHDGEEITDDGLAWALRVGGTWNTGTRPRAATC